MRPAANHLLPLVGLLAGLGPLTMFAQPAPDPRAAPPVSPGVRAAVEQAKPEVYYLKDKEGHLQGVLGFTLEDFERLIAKDPARGGPAPARPGYRLDKIAARGTAAATHADLSATFSVLVDEANWVRVPLRLDELVLRGSVKHEGGGEFFVEYDDEARQYVAWIRGKQEAPHQLTLSGLVPLVTTTAGQQFAASFPAALASELVFAVPGAKVQGRVAAGSVIDTTAAKGNTTEFKILGLTEHFLFSWSQTEQRTAKPRTVLEVTGDLLARIDGRGIQTQADLEIRSNGGEFDSFRVRLPKGAVLLTGDQPDYTVQPINAAAAGGKPPVPSDVIEVRLRNRTSGTIKLRLGVEQPYDPAAKQTSIELGGFEVLGAVRQGGHLAVQVVGDWQVVWGNRKLVRQIETSDLPPALAQENLFAGFEYFAQPFSLPVRVLPQPSRVAVDVDYLVLAAGRRMDLEARLKYRINGAKAFALAIDLASWQLVEVGPASVANVNQLVAVEGQPLSIPLIEPATGEMEITLRAVHELPAGAKALDFALPKPRNATVGASSLVVLPDDNVDLAPRAAELKGLTPQYARPARKLPDRRQPPLAYRVDGPDSRFLADFAVRPRQVRIESSGHVDVDDTVIRVRQVLNYAIAREKLGGLLWQAPRRAIESGKLRIEWLPPAAQANVAADAGPPPATVLDWAALGEADVAAADVARLRVDLPAELDGTQRFAISFELASDLFSYRGAGIEQASFPLSVPLATPLDGDLVANDLVVEAAPGFRLQCLPRTWQVVDERMGGAADRSVLRLSATTASPELDLAVMLDARRDHRPTVVDRCWVQTWFTDVARQDRVVFRFSTSAGRLRLRLPADVQDLAVIRDGQPIPAEYEQSVEQLVVPLPTTAAGERTHVVELRYHFADRRGWEGLGELRLTTPVVADDAWVRQAYWQLVLPRREHLILADEALIPESRWGWEHAAWGRRPLLNEHELAAWSGGIDEGSLPADTNRYLFSSTGPVPTWHARVARLSLVVFGASGAALVCGLLLVYLPWLRHPAILLAAVVGLAAVGVLYPEPSLLVAQAGAAGLLLAMLSGWLYRRTSRRLGRGVVVRASSSAVLDRGSTKTQPHFRQPGLGSHSSTNTAALGVQLSSPEAQP